MSRYIWAELDYRSNKAKERMLRWIAWHLPKALVMWCYFRVVGYATSDKYGDTIVPEITAMEAIGRFSQDHKL